MLFCETNDYIGWLRPYCDFGHSSPRRFPTLERPFGHRLRALISRGSLSCQIVVAAIGKD